MKTVKPMSKSLVVREEEPIKKDKINIGYFYSAMIAYSCLIIYHLITGKLNSIELAVVYVGSFLFVTAWMFNLFCTCEWYKDCGKCVD